MILKDKILIDTEDIKNIIFDFDGVIADTLEIKAEAFQHCYNKYSDKDSINYNIRNYHLKNGGVSRFDKFRYFHKNILNREISTFEIKALSKKFDKYVNSRISNLDATENFINFINKCNKKNLNLFISSAASKKNIKTFLNSKAIFGYFNEIFDQTTNKTDHIIKIKMKYKSNTVNTLFIGDSKSDVEVAFENNLNIILKKHKYNGELFEKFNKLKFFKNFNDINLK